MIMVTFNRMKKAVLRPRATFLYGKRHLRGKLLKLAGDRKISLKRELLRDVYQSWFKHFTLRENPRFLTNELLEKTAQQDFVISTAERICDNEFCFLGMNPKILKRIRWNEDIKSGHSWSNAFYLDLRENIRQSYNKGWDIKAVWELSRCHYLIPLALAFYRTGKEKYARKFQELILSWIKENPVNFGPNWIDDREVSLRVCNWILGWDILVQGLKKHSCSVPADFLDKFLSSLIKHGRFIADNLEYAPRHSNHYLSDLVGLLYLGVMFPEFRESKKWLKTGRQGLEEEIQFQVYDDGVDYELSVSYHRYAAELFLWSGLLCEKNQIILTAEFWHKLKKMLDFSEAIVKPNGFSPQIGDSDDSRLHLLWEDFYNWNRGDHTALFLLGKEIQHWHSPEKVPGNNNFSASGFYVMRDEDFYLMTGRHRCCRGETGSHIHNDILSFELAMSGQDFIVDPGSYVYTADLKSRNRFRRTRAHNTVMIDQQEQNPISADPFEMEQVGDLIVQQWSANEQIVFQAEHDCYARLRCAIVHDRRFVFDKRDRTLLIEDKFHGRGNHELEWNFHLAPEIKVWVKEEKAERKEIILIGQNCSLVLSASKLLNCAIIEDEFSPAYGVKIPAKTIRWSGFLKSGFPTEYDFNLRRLK